MQPAAISELAVDELDFGCNLAKWLETVQQIQRAVRDTEAELAGKGRVILRPSGTEPVIRVTLEGADPQRVKDLAERLADTVRAELGG